MGNKIYSSSNMGTISSGIKWFFRQISPTEHPDYDAIIPTMEGKMGDVIVVTDENIKRLRYVANVFDGYEQQNDSVNIYINESSNEKRIHFFNGWYFDARFNSQSIIINNENLFCPVYFWDEFQHKFVAVQIGYVFKDILSIYSFTGQDIDVDEYWNNVTYSEEFNIEHIAPVVIDTLSDVLTITSFIGQDLDIDDYWNNVECSDDIVIKVNNVIIE